MTKNKKRYFGAIIIVIICICTTVILSASQSKADNLVTDDGFEYEIDGYGNAGIRAYLGAESDVVYSY